MVRESPRRGEAPDDRGSSGLRSRSMVPRWTLSTWGSRLWRPADGRPHDRDRGGRGRRGARVDRGTSSSWGRAARRSPKRKPPSCNRSTAHRTSKPKRTPRIAESAASAAYQASNGFGTVGPISSRCWTRRSPTPLARQRRCRSSAWRPASAAWAAAVLLLPRAPATGGEAWGDGPAPLRHRHHVHRCGRDGRESPQLVAVTRLARRSLDRTTNPRYRGPDPGFRKEGRP